jgi:hypothetical protein
MNIHDIVFSDHDTWGWSMKNIMLFISFSTFIILSGCANNSPTTPHPTPQSTPPATFSQNFEVSNQTLNNRYFSISGDATATLGAFNHNGSRGLQLSVFSDGDTINPYALWIYPSSQTGNVNLSSQSDLTFWVYDASSNSHTCSILIEDLDLVTETHDCSDYTVRNTWHQFSLSLSNYVIIDKTRIKRIQLILNDSGSGLNGVYYLDDFATNP